MEYVHSQEASNRRPGFTMIEVMVTIFLGSVAAMSIVALNAAQIVMVSTQRDTTVATLIGNSLIAQLTGEADNWNSDFDFDATETPFLFYGLGEDANGIGEVWRALPNDADSNSPRFNSLGVPSEATYGGAALNGANTGVNNYAPRYCVHYMLTYVADIMAPNDLLNVQVRVLVPRTPNALTDANFLDCGHEGTPPPDNTPENNRAVLMYNSTDLFRTIQVTTVLAQQTI